MLSRVDGASDFHDKSEVIVLYHALNNQAFARLVLIAGSFYLSFYKNKFVNIIVGFIFSAKEISFFKPKFHDDKEIFSTKIIMPRE